VSVIPAHARLAVDVRAIDAASLDRLDQAIRRLTGEIAARRGVAATIDLVRDGEPVALDAGLATVALEAARERGIAAVETWSGAGHDGQHIAGLVPALLIFVPLHGGESHTPAEGADGAEIADAAALASEVLRSVHA
jgi:acetylornithine deacetylase/succinyl-diaminopimelate desuccinylase-like protein